MIRSYFVIALRSMKRNLSYTLINTISLTVGVACCLLLALYIYDEAHFDRHHDELENLYRVTTTLTQNGERKDPMRTTSAPIVWGIRDEVPEFETVTRLVSPPGVALNLIRYGDKQFFEPDGYIADATLFDIFTYNFIEGNPQKALNVPNSVVITDRLAKKLFGGEQALNKVINIDQGGAAADYRVSGVVSEESRSHLKATFFISMTSDSRWCNFLRSPKVMNEWAGQNFLLSYVQLSENHDASAVVKKMNEAFMKHGAEDLEAMGFSKELGLEPVKEIHLYSTAGGKTARIVYLYVIATIGAFILIIACINFINLSTAKAAKRAREVGMRKTLGAYRSSLIGQFLSEATVIVVLAIVLSLVVVQAMMPAFNAFTGRNMTLAAVDPATIFLALGAITLVTGLIAGSYPAFYLSSFQPAAVLKGKSTHAGSAFLRQILVVLQFFIAIALVCGMLIVGKQLDYMHEKNLGFEVSRKIVLPLRTAETQEHMTAMASELGQLNAVDGVTATNYIPGTQIWTDFLAYPQGGSVDDAIQFRRNAVEPNYLNLLDIPLIAGRSFYDNRADTSGHVIINREGAKQLGFTPESAVGQALYFDWQGETSAYRIAGVMEDYHQVSLKEAIYPLVFFIPRNPSYDFMIVSTAAGANPSLLSDLEAAWKEVNADTPFEFSFLEDRIGQQYEEDRKVAQLINAFTIVAMVISCLGLYGLSTYMAERRFREIGVRKVLGANVFQIISMMSGEFVKLVVIAFALAVPLAWYGATRWLQGFEYKTTIDVSLFAAAGLLALAISIITVGFESFRAASTNPVNALRTE